MLHDRCKCVRIGRLGFHESHLCKLALQGIDPNFTLTASESNPLISSSPGTSIALFGLSGSRTTLRTNTSDEPFSEEVDNRSVQAHLPSECRVSCKRTQSGVGKVGSRTVDKDSLL
jgi:hypothetical protein